MAGYFPNRPRTIFLAGLNLGHEDETITFLQNVENSLPTTQHNVKKATTSTKVCTENNLHILQLIQVLFYLVTVTIFLFFNRFWKILNIKN